MAHLRIRIALILSALLLSMADNVYAGKSCKASSVFGSDCTASCDRRDALGETRAVCRGGWFYAECLCVNTAVATTIVLDGLASIDTKVRIDVYDASCDELPCDPSLLSSVSLDVLEGETPSDFSALVTEHLVEPKGCDLENIGPSLETEVGFRMTCLDFMPKFLICEDPGEPCPDIFEVVTGTDPDIGIVVAGFSFSTEETGSPPPLTVIFADGFESGDLSRWSLSVPFTTLEQ